MDRVTVKTTNGTATTFGYDAVSQLTGDNGTNYTYDATGNRTNAGYVTGTGNQLTNDGTWTYTYDAEGNLTKKSKGASLETWNYTYDQQNHLTAVEKHATDGGTLQSRVTYSYDALGNRSERDVDIDGNGTVDGAERYSYDGVNMLAVLDGSSVFGARYLDGVGVDSILARVMSSSTVAWYVTDYQKSVVAMTDGAGTIQDQITYDGFGKILTETNSSFGDRFKYTSREWDAVTGLQYNHARYYDPAIAKWTSRDPMGFAAGDANLYRYVANGPTNGTDPAGLGRPNQELAEAFPGWETEEPPLARPKPNAAGLPNGGKPINNKPQGTCEAVVDFIGYFVVAIPFIFEKPAVALGHPVANTKPINTRPVGTLGGTHTFFTKPMPGEYVGSGGSFTSVSVIIVCPDGNGCVFHFGTGESDVSGTINQYAWAPGSQAVVFGGDNGTSSNVLLGDVFDALRSVCLELDIKYADFEDVYLGADGQFYHGKPSTNKK